MFQSRNSENVADRTDRLKDTKAGDRKKITASPLQATTEQLAGLPPALIIADENDVLRDEGEAYARKLIAAGVEVTAVRALATFHDFAMLNPLAATPATRAAIRLAAYKLSEALSSAAEKSVTAYSSSLEGCAGSQPSASPDRGTQVSGYGRVSRTLKS